MSGPLEILTWGDAGEVLKRESEDDTGYSTITTEVHIENFPRTPKGGG